MHISRLTPGCCVQCPPDRGEPGYVGRVTNVGTTIYRSLMGRPYVWVHVMYLGKWSAVWPSNRLGVEIPELQDPIFDHAVTLGIIDAEELADCRADL